MDVRAIHYFISVYEQRNFTNAAKKMHVVQSALSMQIRNLEGELKTLLFERTQRGLVPTIAGHRFYELCVPIARNIAAAKQEIFDLTESVRVTGSLRVGLTSSMCHNVLGSVIEEFYSLYPNVEITVMEAYARNITEFVQSGALDVGLGAMPVELNSLSSRLGFSDEYVLVSGRPINGKSLTPCDLLGMKNLKLIIPTERHLVGSTIQNFILSGQLVPKSVMRVDGMVATLEIVRNSDWGAICLMNSMADQLHSKKIFIYPVINPQMQFDLYFLHDVRRPLTLAARRFIELFENRLKEVKALSSSTVLQQ